MGHSPVRDSAGRVGNMREGLFDGVRPEKDTVYALRATCVGVGVVVRKKVLPHPEHDLGEHVVVCHGSTVTGMRAIAYLEFFVRSIPCLATFAR